MSERCLAQGGEFCNLLMQPGHLSPSVRPEAKDGAAEDASSSSSQGTSSATGGSFRSTCEIRSWQVVSGTT
jgi:hypothetical protein